VYPTLYCCSSCWQNANHTWYNAPQIPSKHAVPLNQQDYNKNKIPVMIQNKLQYPSTMIKAGVTGTNVYTEKLQALV
jgi:hypothetical protein